MAEPNKHPKKRGIRPSFSPQLERFIAYEFLVAGFTAKEIQARWAEKSRTGTLSNSGVRGIAQRVGIHRARSAKTAYQSYIAGEQ